MRSGSPTYAPRCFCFVGGLAHRIRLAPTPLQWYAVDTMVTLMADTDIWLTNKDAAQLLSIAPGTLRKWRLADRGPKYTRMPGATPTSGHVRYRRSDVLAWLEGTGQ